MSYTEIVKFTKSGRAKFLGETRNSHRGASAIWRAVQDQYLPPFKPDWVSRIPASLKHDVYYRHSEEEMKEVWELFYSPDLTLKHRIVLGSTYDNVIVYLEDIPTLLEAYRDFEWETSLKEQADLIEAELMSKTPPIAIAWNQTSVNSNHWLYNEYDRTYNILKDTNHWDLFETLR